MATLLLCLTAVAGARAQSADSAAAVTPREIVRRTRLEAGFATVFDNREYTSDYSAARTVFGYKLRAAALFEFGKGHFLSLGGDLTRQIGRHDGQPDPEMMLYYLRSGRRLTVAAGVFPRTLTNAAPPEIFSRARGFYDAAIEGVMLRYAAEKWRAEVVADWYSAQTLTQREKFIIYSSAQWQPLGRLSLGYHLSLQHFATTSAPAADEGVVDNAVLKPWVGVQWRSWGVKAAWLQTFQRDRIVTSQVQSPGGVWLEANARWRSLGLVDGVYLGRNIMPLWERYGTELYLGDTFFRTTHGVYNRLEAFWEPRIGRAMTLRLSSVHHFDGVTWNWQQVISLRVSLNRRTVRN